MSWREYLQADPLPWLLDEDTPAVRSATLQRLLGRPADDPEVVAARGAAMAVDPIRAILDAQDPAGWWVKPGPGYSPKYRGTVWQLIFLAQLGADGADARIARACEYVLTYTQTACGGFGGSGAQAEKPPPPSSAAHCLNGNLLAALIDLGRLEDERVRAAIGWAARAITGEGIERWYASGTSGPGFSCGSNDGEPCAWGALKQLGALARIPTLQRGPLVERALEEGVAYLLSRDPAVADYPMPSWSPGRPSGTWFKLGFPLGYSADVLQTLEVLTALGQGADPRLADAVSFVQSQQGADGRWRNRNAYNGKTWVDIEQQGRPSKWVTLRACTVLRAVHGEE